MAEVVSVATHDNITKIIQAKRGPQPVEMPTWVQRVHKLNPHISNPDQIQPNERLLIPDSLQESVSELAIWQNALRHMPPQLGMQPPVHYEIPIHMIQPGDTVDKLSREAFADSQYWNVPESVKLGIFLHNNPRLYACKWWRYPLPMGTLANMSPFLLSEYYVRQWESQHPIFKAEYSQLRLDVQEFYAALRPGPAHFVSEQALWLKEQGAAVGLDDVVTSSAGGYTAAAAMTINQVNTLLGQITQDAVKKFGKGVVLSNKAVNLRRVEKFLKAHPRFGKVMQLLKEMPKHLIPEADVTKVFNATKTPYANAKFFRKQIFMPALKENSSKYMGTIKSALNSNTRLIKVASRGMYVVPVVLGVYDVFNAPPERRMRVLFEEGFSIMGGAMGAYLGGHVAGTIVASVLCLGPFGFFVAMFLGATIGGLYLANKFKRSGALLYRDIETRYDNSPVYRSVEQLIESF